jgi:bifunctional ADP-heptose synthase (sugar kinase/adenylyltransferase)
MLDNLKNVDFIYIFNDSTPSNPVDILKPNFVLK